MLSGSTALIWAEPMGVVPPNCTSAPLVVSTGGASTCTVMVAADTDDASPSVATMAKVSVPKKFGAGV